jgi:3-oxoacyl-[acyl-carrier-protein] synthase-3
MAQAAISHVRLAGLASAVPALRSVSWEEFGVPADRFLRARAMHARPAIRAARWEQCQSDFCQSAATRLLAELGWSPAEIDVLVLVTLTPDYPIPATAIILQDRLGLRKSTLAFDLPGGSATLFHGLQLIASILSGGHQRRGLLLCGEVSKTLESSASIESMEHICGHNGSVLALEHAPGAAPMFFETGGDGSAFRDFYMQVGGTRCPPQREMFSPERMATFDNPANHFTLNCEAVLATAARELPASVRAVLAQAGKSVNDIDFCFSQAMGVAAEEALRAQLALPKDRFHGSIGEYGGGGSGGVVLGMLARAASRLESGPTNVVLTGIGAGLAWGSAFLTTERVVCPDFIELA